MVQKHTEAATVALNVLEAIRATNPELIADNMPPGWGMNALRMAIQTPPIGIEDRHSIAFLPTSTLPSQHVIVEVKYDSGAVGYSWREGTDEGLDCHAFDTNLGKVIGWRSLPPGHSADQGTLDLHAEMLRRIGSTEPILIDRPRG